MVSQGQDFVTTCCLDNCLQRGLRLSSVVTIKNWLSTGGRRTASFANLSGTCQTQARAVYAARLVIQMFSWPAFNRNRVCF